MIQRTILGHDGRFILVAASSRAGDRSPAEQKRQQNLLVDSGRDRLSVRRVFRAPGRPAPARKRKNRCRQQQKEPDLFFNVKHMSR